MLIKIVLATFYKRTYDLVTVLLRLFCLGWGAWYEKAICCFGPYTKTKYRVGWGRGVTFGTRRGLIFKPSPVSDGCWWRWSHWGALGPTLITFCLTQHWVCLASVSSPTVLDSAWTSSGFEHSFSRPRNWAPGVSDSLGKNYLDFQGPESVKYE